MNKADTRGGTRKEGRRVRGRGGRGGKGRPDWDWEGYVRGREIIRYWNLLEKGAEKAYEYHIFIIFMTCFCFHVSFSNRSFSKLSALTHLYSMIHQSIHPYSTSYAAIPSGSLS